MYINVPRDPFHCGECSLRCTWQLGPQVHKSTTIVRPVALSVFTAVVGSDPHPAMSYLPNLDQTPLTKLDILSPTP